MNEVAMYPLLVQTEPVLDKCCDLISTVSPPPLAGLCSLRYGQTHTIQAVIILYSDQPQKGANPMVLHVGGSLGGTLDQNTPQATTCTTLHIFRSGATWMAPILMAHLMTC